MKRAAPRVACIALVGFAALGGTGWAAFTSKAVNAGNQVTARPDWVAPLVASSVIRKTQGGAPGFIHQGGTYNVFAGVSDSGNPASGVAAVTGDVSSITTGLTASSLAPGTFSIGATAYNYRGSNLTAKTTLAAGTYSYTLTSVDVAGNRRTQTGFTVVVDNTAPTALDVQTTNKSGNVAGTPEIGDTIVFTSSEQLDPNSVLAGWTGAPVNVVVRIGNNIGSGSNDQVSIFDATNATQVALGTVNLSRTDYVSANATFGVTGTPSTMVQSGGAITITLGTASAGPRTAASAAAMVWSPSVTATDRAGNAETAATRTETGTSDRDF